MDILDQEYQARLEEYGSDASCPNCGGKMKHWDLWLATGATCTICGWNYSEGSGCLL